MDIIDHIVSVSLFEKRPGKHQKDLAMVVVDQAFRRGQLFFSEGDDAVGSYIIISGQLKIFKLPLEDREQIVTLYQLFVPPAVKISQF